MAKFKRNWHLFVTATSFAMFGACGLLFSVCIFPVILLWPTSSARVRFVNRLIQQFFRTLVAVLRCSGVMELEAQDVAALRDGRSKIVVANHPTYLDVMVLLALTPRACCVVKSTHWRNPCFWGIVRAAAYIANDDPVKFVDEGARRIAAGYTLIIFPEGSRSPASNRMHAFTRGFARIALKSGSPILPVLMHCSPPAFTKQMRWHQIASFPFRMHVTPLECFQAASLTPSSDPSPNNVRTVTQAVEAKITRNLFSYGFFKTGN